MDRFVKEDPQFPDRLVHMSHQSAQTSGSDKETSGSGPSPSNDNSGSSNNDSQENRPNGGK